jgi:hypothetical protein
MKRAFKLSIALMVFAVIFAACKKEGQYNPGKKVTQIVYSYTATVNGATVSHSQKEVWKWGGSVLSTIDQYDSNGNNILTMIFQYDESNRISEIATTSEETFKYTYSGKYLDKMEYYNHETLVRTYTFERKGKNIVKVTATTPAKDNVKMTANPFVYFIPQSAADMLVETSDAKGAATYELTWDGKNVSSVIANINGTTQSIKWKYDNKINPFMCLLNPAIYSYSAMLSKNNVVEEELTIDGKTTTTTFQYEYDGKYPVKKTYTDTYLGVQRTVTTTITY